MWQNIQYFLLFIIFSLYYISYMLQILNIYISILYIHLWVPAFSYSWTDEAHHQITHAFSLILFQFFFTFFNK